MFFVVVFAVLWQFANMGPVLAAFIAGIVAVMDYFILVWLLRRVAGSD